MVPVCLAKDISAPVVSEQQTKMHYKRTMAVRRVMLAQPDAITAPGLQQPVLQCTLQIAT